LPARSDEGSNVPVRGQLSRGLLRSEITGPGNLDRAHRNPGVQLPEILTEQEREQGALARSECSVVFQCPRPDEHLAESLDAGGGPCETMRRVLLGFEQTRIEL